MIEFGTPSGVVPIRQNCSLGNFGLGWGPPLPIEGASMSALLYRLGRRAAMRPLVPLVSWLFVILAVVALLATQTSSDRKSVVLGNSVDLGGRRFI